MCTVKKNLPPPTYSSNYRYCESNENVVIFFVNRNIETVFRIVLLLRTIKVYLSYNISPFLSFAKSLVVICIIIIIIIISIDFFFFFNTGTDQWRRLKKTRNWTRAGHMKTRLISCNAILPTFEPDFPFSSLICTCIYFSGVYA